MQTIKKSLKKIKVKDLIAQVENHLTRLRYSKSTISHYRSVWRRFLKFCGDQYYNESLGTLYLKECYSIPESIYTEKLPYRPRSEIRGILALADYYRFGQIFPRKNLSAEIEWPVQFRMVIHRFYEHYKKMNSPAWNRRSILVMKSFIQYLDREKISSCKAIMPVHITDFITTQVGYRANTISTNLSYIKTFLRYLYLNRYNRMDLATCIPKRKFVSKKTIPFFWTKEEIDRLLTAVDRGNPCGKRDYAILMLIVRLGLRVGDVRNLQFFNVKWDLGCIEFKQAKTGDKICLPLFEDVGWAIIDYLKNGRPASNSQNIFIRHIAPFNAFSSHSNLHYHINKYLIAAKIKIPVGKPHGLHSLRHTLASDLLQQKVPLPIISDILGHRDINTTKNYLRVDLPMLKKCALNVEV